MKIAVIHGSMRKGNTYALTRAALDVICASGDVELIEVRVADLALPFCTSCHMCFVKGEGVCPHRHIVGPIADAIEDCDALVISGVVHALHLNAALKNLIDHFAYYIHRPRLFGKQALVVATTAGSGDGAVANYLHDTLMQWGITTIRTLRMKIQVTPFSLTEKQAAKVRAVAEAFYADVKARRAAPPSLNAFFVHSAFRGMTRSTHAPSKCDAEYWREHGLQTITYPLKVNPLYVPLGAGVAWLMHKVIDKTVNVD